MFGLGLNYDQYNFLKLIVDWLQTFAKFKRASYKMRPSQKYLKAV